MNSRQVLASAKGGGVEFIYKPGFVDDANLESVKMAVDRELSLISNSFYKLGESTGKAKVELKTAYDQLVSEINTLKQLTTDLAARVADLESKVP